MPWLKNSLRGAAPAPELLVDRQITVQTFPHLKNKQGGASKTGNVREVLEFIGVMHPLPVIAGDAPKFARTKMQAPMFNVACYVEDTPLGANRADGTHQCAYWAVVGDADAMSQGELDTFDAKLDSLGVLHLVTTSFKHAPEAPRLRYVIPMDHDIKADEYRRTWAGLNQLAGCKLDSGAKDPTRRSYFPSCPTGDEAARPKAVIRGHRLGTLSDFPSVDATPKPAPVADWALGADFEGSDVDLNDDLHLTNSQPKHLGRITAECEAVRYGAANQDCIDEPYWRALIGLAKHTVDGRKNAHMLSCRHPEYDEAETDRKFDLWATGPTTCETFAGHNAEACAGCKHKGKIKSPIVLGAEPGTIGMVELPNGTKRPTRKLLKTTLPDWKQNSDGEKTVPLNTTENLSALVSLVGVEVRYNVMTRKTVITIPGLKSERDDYDTAALARMGDITVRAGMSREGLKELTDAVGGTNPFHPAQQWIEATPWDGVPRAKQFHDSFELMDPHHAQLRAALVDAWMLQGIAAMFETEGIAAQGILVLNGEQDVFKTRKVENLCPLPGAVRTGIHLDPLDKDSVFQATSAWITELGEIDSTFRKADVSALKAFTTRSEDVLRRPYAKVDNTYRRRTIFAGTVNGTGFLADSTGDRRFWTLHVKTCHLLSGEVMQQVWAEYLARYRAGERWHLNAETKAALNLSNADHRVVDPLRERIQTSFDWGIIEAENWHARPNVLWLTATDVCMRIGISHPSIKDSTRAGAIVSALNGKVSRKSNGAKLLAIPVSTGNIYAR